MFRIILLIGILGLAALPAFAQNDSSNNTPKDQRLRITNRPKVVYPTEAKRNKVYGPVTVAITFQADGTIGEVRCVNEHNEETQRLIKYHVVEAVMDMAKKIEFEPEIKDGKPVTVTKKIEYTYSTY